MSEHLKEIAERLVALREMAGVSAGELCESLSISEAEYMDLESGERDIPVSVLWEVARYFNISITELLTGNPAKLHTYSITRKDKGIPLERTAGYNYKALAYGFSGREVEPLLVTVEPEPDELSPVHLHVHAGQEFHYCLEGGYTFYIEDKQVDMRAGDSLYFISSKPHAMRAGGDTPAKLIVIVIPEKN